MVDEAGLMAFHFSFWQAPWAPEGTPIAIIEKLDGAVVASLTDPINTANALPSRAVRYLIRSPAGDPRFMIAFSDLCVRNYLFD